MRRANGQIRRRSAISADDGTMFLRVSQSFRPPPLPSPGVTCISRSIHLAAARPPLPVDKPTMQRCEPGLFGILVRKSADHAPNARHDRPRFVLLSGGTTNLPAQEIDHQAAPAPASHAVSTSRTRIRSSGEASNLLLAPCRCIPRTPPRHAGRHADGRRMFGMM